MTDLELLENNFAFMLLQVVRQVTDVHKLLQHKKNRHLAEKILERDDSINNLNSAIETQANALLAAASSPAKFLQDYVHAVHTAAHNLESIADFCVDIAAQTKHFQSLKKLQKYHYRSALQIILKALHLVEKAFREKDLALAVKICTSERKLDRIYSKTLKSVLKKISKGNKSHEYLTILFVFQYLQRMGDCLLNIGEEVLTLIFGEKLKYTQYQALSKNLFGEKKIAKAKIAIESVGETKSGCLVRKVRTRSAKGKKQFLIFKEGKSQKIIKEHNNLKAWHKLKPGIVPKLVGFRAGKINSSMVVSYLHGQNLHDILLTENIDQLEDVFTVLANDLNRVWKVAKLDKPYKAHFLKQLTQRLDDVFATHPEFNLPPRYINTLKLPGLYDMLEQACAVEEQLSAPFCHFIHGDFNLDNILFDAHNSRINFIDVYRSREYDYVQDISVFLVSCFRIKSYDKAVRKRIEWLINAFLKFSRGYARRQHDETFEARLALGIIRSLITSTRFEMDSDFALMMFTKAIYLLEMLTSWSGELAAFKFDNNILSYDNFTARIR